MAAGSKRRPNDLFTALAHPVRRKILRRMHDDGGEIAPRDLELLLDEPLSILSYHVRILAVCGAVELVRTIRVRGSTQHLYRSTVKAGWALAALDETEGPARKERS